MSYDVSALVRACRLPRVMVNRPAAKGVLLSLADDCRDAGDGFFTAWTSVATMAQEAEISPRTVDAHLAALRERGLISEHSPPRQHRPRTWRLHLIAILELVVDAEAIDKKLTAKQRENLDEYLKTEAQQIATLTDPETQPLATLSRGEPGKNTADPQVLTSDPQLSGPGSQLQNPGSQNSGPDSQAVATERYNGTKNNSLNGVNTGASAKNPKAKKADGNLQAVREVMRPLLATKQADSVLLQRAKSQCIALNVDLGDSADDLLGRAMVLEKGRAIFYPPQNTEP